MHVDATIIRDAVQPLVRICVRDNGPGIAELIQDELFEPFVSTKPEGLGLGLALVRRAAEYLGGHVRWKRENGSTIFEFTSVVTLPASPSDFMSTQ